MDSKRPGSLPLVLIAGATLLAPVCASALPEPTVVFTELSSSSLSVVGDGLSFTVTDSSPDHWSFVLPLLGQPLPNGAATSEGWIEPGNSAAYNVLTFSPSGSSLGPWSINIVSDSAYDATAPGALAAVADSTAVTLWLPGNGGSAAFEFVDQGDTTSVPEPATLSMLALGLAGASLLRRRKAS